MQMFTNEKPKPQAKMDNVSTENLPSNTVQDLQSIHNLKKQKDSLTPNNNLKFISQIPPQKIGKPFNSEVVQPVNNHFGFSRDNLINDKPFTHFEASFDKSFLDKSAEWKMFKESHDNLEVGAIFFDFF